MNVVYVVQSGAGGPITVGTSTDRGYARRLASLQAGNPLPLTLLQLLDGDERLERRLHGAWARHRIRGDWYAAAALDELELDALPRLPHDDASERRRQAAALLADLAPRSA